jgi:hypothetical protein
MELGKYINGLTLLPIGKNGVLIVFSLHCQPLFHFSFHRRGVFISDNQVISFLLNVGRHQAIFHSGAQLYRGN